MNDTSSFNKWYFLLYSHQQNYLLLQDKNVLPFLKLPPPSPPLVITSSPAPTYRRTPNTWHCVPHKYNTPKCAKPGKRRLHVLNLGNGDFSLHRCGRAAPTLTGEQGTGHWMSQVPLRIWNKNVTRMRVQLAGSVWLRQARKACFTAASTHIQFLDLPCPLVATSRSLTKLHPHSTLHLVLAPRL